MKFQSSALVILLSAAHSINSASAFGIAGQKSTFLSTSLRVASSSTRRSGANRDGLTMLAAGSGGIEELEQMVKEGDKLTQSVKKSPGLFKAGGMAAVPAAAILGAVVAPGAVAGSVAGAAISGVGGFIGKNRLDVASNLAAKPSIAQAIIDVGIDSAEIASVIVGLQSNFAIDDDEFAEACSDVYKRYIIGMVKTPITTTSEMKELVNLRNALSMDNLAVGEAHGAAAKEFYRQTALFTPLEDLEDPDHPDRMSIDKYLFLSERTFRQAGETDEAFKFEMSRIAKAFDISLGEALDRVAEVAEPFYQKALDSTRSKLETDAVSADMLLRARNSLGIDELSANDMNLNCFTEEVQALLGKAGKSEEELATIKFSDGSSERLSKLQGILGLEDHEADYEISSEATAIFQANALAGIEEAIAGSVSAEDVWVKLSKRKDELLLKDTAMKDILSSMVMQAMGKPFEETMTFAKVNNEGATEEKLVDALAAKEVCRAVFEQSGWEEFSDFDKAFFDPASKSSACGMLARQDRLRLYRIFLTRAVRSSESGKELTEDSYNTVKEVKNMLGITDEDEATEFRVNFGPELQKSLNMAMFEIMGDDFTTELVANLKEMVDKTVNDYRLSEDLVASFAAPIYARAVILANDKVPGGFPTSDVMKQLDALRGLLGMSEADGYPAHLDTFGGAYKKSVQESMGATGVITEEYRAPLVTLRERLGVSAESARGLYLEAMEERMIPMVEWIVLELERTMLTAEQLAQKRQKDFGEDYFKTGKGADGTLGLGAEANIMTDIMNLIDFYNENDIAEEKLVGTKTVDKKVMEDGEEKTVSEEVDDFETVYPVTGLESGAVKEDVSELLFRQFVVGGFTTQGPQGERYEAARSTFGGIIGLSKEKQDEVTSSIGGTVYENYISNSMRTKGALDQQDMMFLANIQGKLDIPAEKSEEMLLATQKKILKEEANVLLGDDADPAAVKAFRDKCNSMGMEPQADLELSKSSVEDLFEKEVSPALVSGEITIDNGEILSEIQDSLGMDPEEAEKVFFDIVVRRAQSVTSRMRAEILRGREENCVDLIERLVRYSQFSNGEDLDLNVDESIGWKIFNLYDAMDFEGQDAETVSANKDLLKTALNLN
jgi:hypothetical protein